MTTDDLIFVLIHSLKYEPDPSQALILKRSEFWRMRSKKHPNELIERAGETKFSEEVRRIRREATYKAYDKAIMKKYNVGPDYRSNRWFMEQVRPSLN